MEGIFEAITPRLASGTDAVAALPKTTPSCNRTALGLFAAVLTLRAVVSRAVFR